MTDWLSPDVIITFILKSWFILIIVWVIAALMGKKNVKRKQWQDDVFKLGLKQYYKRKRKKYKVVRSWKK